MADKRGFIWSDPDRYELHVGPLTFGSGAVRNAQPAPRIGHNPIAREAANVVAGRGLDPSTELMAAVPQVVGGAVGRTVFDAAKLAWSPVMMAAEQWGSPATKSGALGAYNEMDKWKNVLFPDVSKGAEPGAVGTDADGNQVPWQPKDSLLTALESMAMKPSDLAKAPARVAVDYTVGMGTMLPGGLSRPFDVAQEFYDEKLAPSNGGEGNEALSGVLELATLQGLKKPTLRQAAKAGRFDTGKRILAGDSVPGSIFGIPVIASGDQYTETDLDFFREHPEAGGYYDMGDGEGVEDGSPEGAPVQADMPRKARGEYGLRPDGTPKGSGWLGPVEIRKPDGSAGVMTEYSVGVQIDGKETSVPSLVPTLTPEEVELMRTDIVPNGKQVPLAIVEKAADFARKRIARGLSVWASEEDPKAAAFAKRNPTLFGHVKGFEKLRLEPYDDVGGKAIGYGAHTDLDDLPVTAETRFSEHMANMALARDLYKRRERLRATIPNWDRLSGGAKQALLDVSMGADNVLTEAKSKGLFKNLRSTTDPRLLNEYVKNHYYSYRNPDDANTREGLEARRIAGGKLFFGDTFSYEGKTWDENQNKFVPAEDGKGKTK